MSKKEKKILSNEELASFFRQTALLFASGIRPAEGMQILINDCKNPKGRALLEEIHANCKKGEHFNKALKLTGVFPDYVINMIALGEDSGKTDECMTALADFYEKEQAVSDNLRSALTYPIVMITMMLVVIIVLVSRVMPIFEQVFNELGTEMTGFAGSMLNVGKYLNRYSIGIMIFLGLLVVFYLLANNTGWGKKLSRRLLVNFPLTRDYFESIACERFASALAIGLASGMETYSSLDMAKKMVEHHRMEKKIDVCAKAIKDGSDFSEALISAGIFSNLYSQMLAVGAASGNTDVVLSQIADSYEKQATKKIQTLLSILEPTLVIILSLIVGMILLSVILPLMGIMSSIG